MEQNYKGTTLLKVTGILMIIGGSISTILSIVGFAAIAALSALMDSTSSMGIFYAGAIFSLVSAVATLVAGIIGVVNCKKPEKAGACMAWGIIVALLSIAAFILTRVAGGDFNYIGLVTGLILPILLIVGANMNKKSLSA